MQNDDQPMDAVKSDQVGEILATPGLAEALDNDRFKQFLDHIPVAIAVSELQPSESITYANLEFERLTGLSAAQIIGNDWRLLPGVATSEGDNTALGTAVYTGDDYIGSFTIANEAGSLNVDAWSNTIEDEGNSAMFRLVALASRENRGPDHDPAVDERLRAKDAQLMELQHRVKNNLQMITALVRMEARSMPAGQNGVQFERLAGRIGALALLYNALSGDGLTDTVDLGAYLGQVAAAVMQAHATEGMRLETRVDTWPVSINVAMPTGLVVNELITNALKHAFVGRSGGVISLTSTVDANGCNVVVSDDGIGMPDGMTWPTPGRLGAVIANSLRQNAKAKIDVASQPEKGVRVAIFFAREPVVEIAAS